MWYGDWVLHPRVRLPPLCPPQLGLDQATNRSPRTPAETLHIEGKKTSSWVTIWGLPGCNLAGICIRSWGKTQNSNQTPAPKVLFYVIFVHCCYIQSVYCLCKWVFVWAYVLCILATVKCKHLLILRHPLEVLKKWIL